MTHYPRIKICGITSVADAEVVAAAGADAIGLVFYGPSPRNVELVDAARIAKAVGPFVSVVGLFVDPTPSYLQAVIESVPLHVLQFHGNESRELCELSNRPYLKVFRVAPEAGEKGMLAIEQQAAEFASASAILLDTLSSKAAGGSGERFDWASVPQSRGRHWIVAGGLAPDNVAAAIRQTRPYGVDVSSGVESAPGKKDPAKVRAFIQQVRGSFD